MSVFDADAHLPPLPLPALSETCDRLKELLAPLTFPEEYARACRAVDGFAVSGVPLQDALQSFREERGGNESWLRPLWDDSYLAWRGKLPMEMNYVLELRPERWGDKPLASFILALCRFFRNVGSGNLPVETVRGEPRAMDSLRFMAYTRIPHPFRDILYRPPLAGPARVAVASCGRWFILTLSDAGGALVSVDEAHRALRSIPGRCARMEAHPPVAAMTSAKRDDAAAVRTRLLADAGNREALSAIENCLFSVSLDAGGDNFERSLLAGDAADRWFDKSLQVISHPDGRLGINLEHAGCDAGLWVYALDQVDRDIRESGESEGGRSAPAASSVLGPAFGPVLRPLSWVTDREAAEDLSRMHAAHNDNAARLRCAFRFLDTVGREKIKALGCGPDAFIQIAFQAAWYRLTGTCASVYEAVCVRNFYQGRTECARPATPPVLECARLLAEDIMDGDGLRAAFRQAGREHANRLARCRQGLGAERHLFGLAMMARLRAAKDGTPIPSLFDDPAVLAATRNTLSTSSVQGPAIRFFGFGPVCENGLGIGYAMTGEGLQLAVTSLPSSGTSADLFADATENAMALMAAHLAG